MDILFHPDRSLFQVTGKEQKIPEIILRIIDISVCDVFMNRFFYDAAGYKIFDFSFYLEVRPLKKVLYYGIGTGIFPIRGRKCCRVY